MPRLRILLGGVEQEVHLDQAIDVSRPLHFARATEAAAQPQAFYLQAATAAAVEVGSFVGDIRRGGSCQCDVLTLSPHGNGTHTECLRHVQVGAASVRQAAPPVLVAAQLVSVAPQVRGPDQVVDVASLEGRVGSDVEAVVIRTLPNDTGKMFQVYSGQNPPYLTQEAAAWLSQRGVAHLVLDLPSADREDDGGLLAAHRAFFAGRDTATITELAYVPNLVPDGVYLLNLQLPPFELDAAPSRPMLIPLS